MRCNSKSELGLRMRYRSAEMTVTRAQQPLPSRGSPQQQGRHGSGGSPKPQSVAPSRNKIRTPAFANAKAGFRASDFLELGPVRPPRAFLP